jgi:hypothetical protein
MAEYIAYQCATSTETRGTRPVGVGFKAPLSADGCGHWNIRRMMNPLGEYRSIQGSPCTQCTRRQRLNRGNTYEAPQTEQVRDWGSPDGWRTRQLTDDDKRAWAIERARRGNEQEAARRVYVLEHERENATRMSNDSNAIEQVISTIEQTTQTIEQTRQFIEQIPISEVSE